MTSPEEPLSPARLGEIVAHARHYEDQTFERILEALGYSTAMGPAIAAAKEALHAAIEGGDVQPLRDFVQGFDIVSSQLRVRKPKLEQTRRMSKLSPQRTSVAPPLPNLQPARPAEPAPTAMPSYLRAADGRRAGGAKEEPLPTAVVIAEVESSLPPARTPGTTCEIDHAQIFAGMKLPFAGASQPTSAENNLDTFARLTVALSTDEPRESVLARFHLSEPQRRALASHWVERINQDANLRHTFEELVRKHRGR